MVKNGKIASKGSREEAGKTYRDILWAYLGEPDQRIRQEDDSAQNQQWHPS